MFAGTQIMLPLDILDSQLIIAEHDLSAEALEV
jgi:hypothetical protein